MTSEKLQPRDETQICVPRKLGQQIRTVSAALGMNIKEYAEARLRAAVDADMPRVLEQMTAATK